MPASLRILLTLCLVLPAAGSWAEPTTRPRQTFDTLLNPVRYRDARTGDDFYPVNINNWWGYVAQNGDLIVFPNFDWADYFYENRGRAVSNGKTGYLKTSGNWLIEPVFPYADRFAEGYAVVGDGEGKFGFIDLRGKALTPVQFDGALRFKDGVAAAQVGNRIGFINQRGRWQIEPVYLVARSFHDSVAAVRLANSDGSPGWWGYIDKTGELRFADKTGRITELGDFNESLARVKVRTPAPGSAPGNAPGSALGNSASGEAWGYIDKSYKLRIEPAYDEARDFTDGGAAVKVGKKWGYIDKTGRWLVEPRFDSADDFDDALTMVSLDGLYGFVDKVGSRGVEAQFAWAEPFFLRFARVEFEPNFAYIDLAGRVVWDPRAPLKLGIVDTRPKTRLAVEIEKSLTGDPVLDPPPLRAPIKPPYPPEYLYEEVLPVRRNDKNSP